MAKISPLMMAPPLLFAGLAAMFMWGMNRGDPNALPSTREGAPVPELALSQLGEPRTVWCRGFARTGR